MFSASWGDLLASTVRARGARRLRSLLQFCNVTSMHGISTKYNMRHSWRDYAVGNWLKLLSARSSRAHMIIITISVRLYVVSMICHVVWVENEDNILLKPLGKLDDDFSLAACATGSLVQLHGHMENKQFVQ